MARKAKPKRDELPLDDPRWLPIRDAHKLILEHTRVGDPYLAARDLTDEIQTGGVCSMRRKLLRSTFGPERQINPRNYWENLELNAAAEVVQLDFETDAITPVTEFQFYVWEPHIVKRWPELQPVGDEHTAPSPPPRKPGNPPKHDWPLFVAHEVIRRAKAGEKDPTATAMIKLCETELGVSPGLKEVQILLRKLLHGRF